MPDCQAGHAPIDGRPFLVDVHGPERVPMCAFHGRTVQYGEALVKLLGRDHVLVVPIIVALAEAMDSACPEVEGVSPSKGTCAQGTQDPYYVGGPGPRGAGVPNGTAAA